MHSPARKILVGLLLASSTLLQAQKADQTSLIQKHLTIYTDVMRQLDVNYVDTLNYEDLVETAIQQMLRKVDPYTVYIPKSEDDNLKMMTTGKYGGIGAIIMQRDSFVMVSEPYAGNPAAENDVLAGDTIVSVDGFDCFKKTTKDVSDHLRGNPGTKVKITLRRGGYDEPLVREFERREIHLPAVTYSTKVGGEDSGIGYILFSEFTSGSAQDFLVALERLVREQGVNKLIIDLRGNGGGIIDEAIQMVSYFVDKGTEVVTTKGKTEASNRSYNTRTSPIYKDMPLVVLVDRHSASAAEIVSGSLQDFHRATLIGQRTFGKGLVQSVRPIAYEGHLKVTTAHYYLPSGRCIQAIDYSARQKGEQLKRDTAGGILPDIVMDDSAKVDITYSLYIKHMLFDYSTRYHRMHDTIAPADQFELSDAEIEDFLGFLDERGFEYETETSKYFKQTLEVAEHEDLDSTTIASLKAFKAQLIPSYREAVYRNLQAVKDALAAEIVQRYYFQQGRVAYLLRSDKELERAIEIIRNEKE